jgi:hypothetical protein
MSTAVRFEDPAHLGRGRPSQWGELLGQVAGSPNKWAVIREYDRPENAYAAAHRLSTGKIKSGRPESENWVFTARKLDDDTTGLFAMRIVERKRRKP